MSTLNPNLLAALTGRYIVERELGQGGMATVYLATDVRHDRKVALKVLRPELAAVIGAERFLAEIKTTAGLQHPHILPLHDSGEANGTVFYVMPFVQGESLRDRLRREKQLPVDEAIRLTKEVASALDYAHRHGIVHRDIKPENILLHDGQALVADFGIALAVSRSDSSTRMTETGMSLGTPHYMAPEQAMGEREITPKVDVYALGAVLYEMLTGDPPFTGSTAQAIVARVVTESPRPITLQRHTVPVHVEAAVLRALEKLPADRFATPGEFARALEHADGAPRAGTSPHRGTAARRNWRATLAVPLAVTTAVLAIALVALLSRPAPTPVVARYGVAFPPDQAPVINRPFEVSPDGRLFAYIGPEGIAGWQIWLKDNARDVAVPIAGTGNPGRFAFSPSSDRLAFTQGSQVKSIPVVGGGIVTLADDVAPARGIAWMDDGSVVFVSGTPLLGRQLMRVPPSGGSAELLWTVDTSSFSTAWNPAPLPGGRGVLFSRCTAVCGTGGELWVLNLKSRRAERLMTGVVGSAYVEAIGHIVYVRPDGGLLAVPFDAGSLKLRGNPIPVGDSVARGFADVPLFAVSSAGRMFLRAGPNLATTEVHELVGVDRACRETAVDSTFRFRLTVQGENRGWALSPNGRHVAIGLNTDAGDDVWVKELPAGGLSRATFDTLPEHRPRWSKDGESISFLKYSYTSALYRRSADGRGADELVLGVRGGVFEGAISPDGKWLVVRLGGQMNVSGGRDIHAMQIGVDTVPKPLVATPQFDESTITLSPDGRWLAYESNETSRSEVYIRPFPDVNSGKWQVSNDGGRAPLWARSGREIFYVNAAREMNVVQFGASPTPQIGARRKLFVMRNELYLAEIERYTPFDISPDGLRFLMARRVSATEMQPAPLIMTENWFEELRRIIRR